MIAELRAGGRIAIVSDAGTPGIADPGGRIVEAAEAFALGLVNALSEPETLLDDALALAASIAANSPGGVQLSKRALQANMEAASYAAAIELENRGQAPLHTRCGRRLVWSSCDSSEMTCSPSFTRRLIESVPLLLSWLMVRRGGARSPRSSAASRPVAVRVCA